jgi:tetratricopeptide (TPR) repeat protein
MNQHTTAEIVRGTLILIMTIGLVGWFIVLTIRRSEDPSGMIRKWVYTFALGGLMYSAVFPIMSQGGYAAAFVGIPLTAAFGLGFTIIWRHTLAGLIAKPFSDLYDGGSTPPEPRPLYSVAQSRQKQGLYEEAVVEIRKQLELFPTDLEGQLLLAQIQAENLRDLPAAEQTIRALCAQPGHAPKNIAFALYSLADWHLSIGADRAGAQRALEEIGKLLPDSEFSLNAAQRLAHLDYAETALSPHSPRTFAVPEGIKNVGLAKALPSIAPKETDPGLMAAEYVKHLEKHPLDTEAREKLAAIYADHFKRLDLAVDQLEQLIQEPHRPARLAVRWLNQMADLQVRSGADYETVWQTLQRIVDLDPKLAAADTARRRMDLLKLEFKARETNEDVKMGSYEQNIGLKRGSAPRYPSEQGE